MENFAFQFLSQSEKNFPLCHFHLNIVYKELLNVKIQNLNSERRFCICTPKPLRFYTTQIENSEFQYKFRIIQRAGSILFFSIIFHFSYNFLIYLKKGEREWGSNLLEPSLGYITDIIQSVSNTKFYMSKKNVSWYIIFSYYLDIFCNCYFS